MKIHKKYCVIITSLVFHSILVFLRKRCTLGLYNTKYKLCIVRWRKQKLNVVLQQEKPLVQDKEMQQKEVLKVVRGDVRIKLLFLNFVI
jgi:hypothetical protein